jgi:hypothetical protein
MVAHQLGASLNSRAASFQTSGEINPRISYPSQQLAMDLQLPLRSGHIGGFAGASSVLSNFRSTSPLVGAMLPATVFEPALMYRQRQQLLAQQQQQQLLSSRNMMLRGDHLLQSELARAQLIDSLRWRSQRQGGEQNEQYLPTQRYRPFSG